MTGNEIRAAYLAFMEKKGHAIVPSASLIPENDPTTLFTGSGMQPMVPYLLGETHPKGKLVANSQKCFRAEDIEEVGDNRHTTVFEMLGNWSFGDYFKREQIHYMFDFLVHELKLDPQRLYITVFGGDEANNLPKDDESPTVWQEHFGTMGIQADIAFIGSESDGYKRGMKEGERIFFYDAKKNWWSRAGVPNNMPIGEPGGPDSEMFYDFGTEHDPKWGEHCHPNCDCGRFIEIGNNVFMQYVKVDTQKFDELTQKNIDFGGGLERITAAVNDDNDIFKIDLLWTVIEQIQILSGKKYEDNLEAFRVITDHIRGAVLMISEAIYPSNTEQGYFTRRLLRRAVRYADIVGIPPGELKLLAKAVIDTYKAHYAKIAEHESDIIEVIHAEELQFRKTLENGLKEFNKVALSITIAVKKENGKIVTDHSKARTTQKFITGENAFNLFSTYGFPIELTVEIAKERGMTVALDEYEECMRKHRELSRSGSEQKFKGGLADNSEKVVMYHTATHLLLAGLRKELGDGVHQAGSNITNERLRFDFTYDEKVSDEILKKVEQYVNIAIKNNAHVTVDTIQKSEAEKDESIEGSFWDKYPDQVKVYSITGTDGTVYSRELCGGPHVPETGAITGIFKIKKEESSSKGVRRIKAILE